MGNGPSEGKGEIVKAQRMGCEDSNNVLVLGL